MNSRGRHHHRRHRTKQLEDFESADFQNTGSPTSYDLIAQSCGGTAADLKRWARILRLKPSCTVYDDIVAYVKNSMDIYNVTVQRIYKVTRHGERDPFDDSFRIFLWHGTSSSNIPSIVQNGFRLGTMGAHNWFGGGVYFADRIAMSCGFTQKSPGGNAFLILAEVAPGRVYKAHHIHTNFQVAPPGFDTVKGMGSQIPTWKQNRHYFGAIMPCGVSTLNTRYPQFDLPYNEYIIYDTNRIIIRFIVECSF